MCQSQIMDEHKFYQNTFDGTPSDNISCTESVLLRFEVYHIITVTLKIINLAFIHRK